MRECREPECSTSWSEVDLMRKTLIALVAAATVVATAFATSNKAEAWWGWWWFGAVVGGVVAGTIIGSAIAPRPYYPYGYYGPYYGPYPYGPRCHWNRINTSRIAILARNPSPATQESYLNAVPKFNRYFGRSPDRLGLEDVHAFQVHLVATFVRYGFSTG
jgi:hypothetical protein